MLGAGILPWNRRPRAAESVDGEAGQLDGDDLSVALCEDTVGGAVLQIAVPHHDEVAQGVYGHGRFALGTRRVRVHAEIRAERRTGAQKAPAEHAQGW